MLFARTAVEANRRRITDALKSHAQGMRLSSTEAPDTAAIHLALTLGLLAHPFGRLKAEVVIADGAPKDPPANPSRTILGQSITRFNKQTGFHTQGSIKVGARSGSYLAASADLRVGADPLVDAQVLPQVHGGRKVVNADRPSARTQ